MNVPIVYLVDDDAAVRDSLGLLCETAGLKVESYGSAEAFLEAYRPGQPGCLVLDVRMGGMSGPELHAELTRRGCPLPVIYLSGHGDIPMTVKAIKAGAMDFLTKPVSGAEFLERVQAALQQVRDQVGGQEALADRHRRLAMLTPREREIMVLVLAGQANKTIAKRLGISYRTVEIHRSHLLHKAGVSNLLELAQFAADCGLGAAVSPSNLSPLLPKSEA